MAEIPALALSVRQPWAWALSVGLKDIENRSRAAVSKGDMHPRRIAIHAAKGMTRDEYEDAAEFMFRLRVACPRPERLVRGGIIGAATVVDVVASHDSPWFFGPRGLVLADAVQLDPIPALGALGYFRWQSSGSLCQSLPWMTAWPGEAVRRRAVDQRQPPLWGKV